MQRSKFNLSTQIYVDKLIPYHSVKIVTFLLSLMIIVERRGFIFLKKNQRLLMFSKSSNSILKSKVAIILRH